MFPAMIACDYALYVHAIHVCKHKVSSLTTHRKQHEYIFSYKVVTSTFLCLGEACFSSHVCRYYRVLICVHCSAFALILEGVFLR